MSNKVSSSEFYIHLLGTPKVLQSDQLVEILRRKSRAVLYYLAAQSKPVSRSQLIGLFWPDLPRPSALQTLRSTLYGLRQAVGSILMIDGDQISLSDQAWVDFRIVEARLKHITDLKKRILMKSNPGDLKALHDTLSLYQGEFLSGFTIDEAQLFDDWMVIERERIRRLVVGGFSTLASAYELQGDFSGALASLEQALSFNPLQEDLQRETIRLLYLAGDRPAAIRRYDELRKLLDEEMGVLPMAETRALYDAIITERLPAALAATKLASQPKRLPIPSTGLPFIGRQEDLKSLENLLTRYPVVLIEGEPGIGKTRLVEEHLHRAAHQQRNTVIFVGKGRELDQSIPYQPWIEALRGLMRHPEWNVIFAQLQLNLQPIWFSEISRLLPEFSESNPGKIEYQPPADEARVWEAVYQILSVLSRRWMVYVFLDDLQWLDLSSLRLLGYLVRQEISSQLLFIITARPMALRSPQMVFIQTAQRESRLARLSLARLGQGCLSVLEQFLSDKIQPELAHALADWLWRTSEGNPYILTELVREILQRVLANSLPEQFFQQMTENPLVPQTVVSLVQSRLLRLSESARRLLDAAVAAGREFEFDVVSLATGLSDSAALDALDELLAEGLITPVQNTQYMFDHALTMEVAYRDVGRARHRILHRQIARALETFLARHTGHADQIFTLVGQIARHFAEAEDFDQAASYAFQAGQSAALLAGWNEAISFFELALRGWPETKHRQVHLALGNAYSKTGLYAQASEAFRQALRLANQENATTIEIDPIYLMLARSYLPQARFAEALAAAQEVCTSTNPHNAISAELIMGTALSIEGRDLQTAQVHLWNAEMLWQEHDHRNLSSLALIKFELGSVAAQLGQLPLAVEYYQHALSAVLQTKDESALEQLILIYNNLAYHLHLLSPDEASLQALEYAKIGLALAQEKGVMGLQAYLYSTLGQIAMAQGDFDLAEAHFRQGLTMAERFSIRERIAGLTANLGLVALQRGEDEENRALALHRLSTALSLADTLGTQHLAVQIRIWLAPLLPVVQGRQYLAEARLVALSSGREGLVSEIDKLQAGM